MPNQKTIRLTLIGGRMMGSGIWDGAAMGEKAIQLLHEGKTVFATDGVGNKVEMRPDGSYTVYQNARTTYVEMAEVAKRYLTLAGKAPQEGMP